ncbi:hypothetical protein TSMEX_011767 [Taenia solium]|eukprot:TsM_000197900 transcript=TsM_000197900 gene=TsM_000197900
MHQRMMLGQAEVKVSDAVGRSVDICATRAFRRCWRPLLVLGDIASGPKDAKWIKKNFPILDAILGALHALCTPQEIGEVYPKKARTFDNLLVFDASEHLLRVVYAMEEGRRVARNIAGSDPERMSALRIVEYLTQEK